MRCFSPALFINQLHRCGQKNFNRKSQRLENASSHQYPRAGGHIWEPGDINIEWSRNQHGYSVTSCIYSSILTGRKRKTGVHGNTLSLSNLKNSLCFIFIWREQRLWSSVRWGYKLLLVSYTGLSQPSFCCKCFSDIAAPTCICLSQTSAPSRPPRLGLNCRINHENDVRCAAKLWTLFKISL